MALSVGELVAYLRLDSAGFDKGLGAAKRSLDLTGESATKMGGAVDKSEVALKGAGRAAETASAASGKLRAAQLSVVAAQERYNTLMTEGSGNTARLASAEAALIRSQERLAVMKPPADPGGMAKLRTGALGALETVGKLGLSLGAFELAIKGIEYLKAGNELTTALNGVAAASQASDAQMTKVRAAAIGMGKDLTIPKATAVDAADAIQDLVKAGVSLDRAMVAARPALLLAAAAQVNIADAARVTGDVMDDFHLKADQAGHVANVLAAASNSAGGGLMDLFDGMKYAGPSARVLGLDVSSTAAALVELAKSGMQGSLGGTAFSNMLARLNPTAKGAKEALHDLGVSAYDANGKFVGLPKVFDQLHSAMLRMNPQQFSQAVQIAFGARAKNAVFNFAHGGAQAFDEFYKKMQAGDVQAYADKMNRGLSAAGAQLRKEVTAWAIDLGDKFQPALAKATFAVGNDLPKAVSTLSHVLQPLGQELMAVLVPAWHALGATLGVVGPALVDVGHVLDQHRGTVQVVGTVVLGMWAAWKGYTIATSAVRAIASAVETMRLKAMMAKDSIAGIATGATAISAGTLALGGLGIALGIAAYAWQKHQREVEANKQAVNDFTSALLASKGAIDANVQASIAKELSDKGIFDAGQRLGVSQRTVMLAFLNNADALKVVNTATSDASDALTQYHGNLAGAPKAAIDANNAIDTLAGGLANVSDNFAKSRKEVADQQAALGNATTTTNDAAAAAKALASATVYTVDATGQLVQSQQVVGGKVNDTTEELVKQKSAADLLKASLDALNGVAVSQEQTTNAFLDSLDSLDQSVKDNGKSLDQNTAKGRKNREAIVSIIQAAKDQAQATADTAAKTMSQTDALKTGNAQLAKNEEAIRRQAKHLGLSKAATDALIKSLGQLSTVKPIASTVVKADTKPALTAVQSLQKQLDSVKQGHPVVLGAKSDAGRAEVAELQHRIDAIAQGKVPGLNADSKAGRSEVAALQGKIDAIKQGKAVSLDANSAGARAKAVELQKRIDAIKQGHPVGLDASAQAAIAKIASLQGQINRIRQDKVPGLDADSSAARRKIADLQAQINALQGKTIPINFALNGNVGQAVHNAVNSIPSSVRVPVSVPGGRTPGNAAGGGMPDGWSTVGEQGWEAVHKQGNQVQVFSNAQSKKLLPQGPSVPAFAKGTAGNPTTPYQYDGIYYATAVAAANAKTRALRAAPKAPKAPKLVQDSLVAVAGQGAVYGLAQFIRGQIPSVRTAVQELSAAVNDAFSLRGVLAQVATVKADLANLAAQRSQLSSGVTSTLMGNIDISKYGDAGSLVAALQNGTAVNNHFSAEQMKLASEKVPQALIQALAANGPSAGLDTLAGASKTDLAQIIKSYNAFSATAVRGGGEAGKAVYGAAMTADQAKLAALNASAAKYESAIVKLVGAIGAESKKPIEIKLDGKVIAHGVISSGEFAGVMNDLTHVLTTGRRK